MLDAPDDIHESLSLGRVAGLAGDKHGQAEDGPTAERGAWLAKIISFRIVERVGMGAVTSKPPLGSATTVPAEVVPLAPFNDDGKIASDSGSVQIGEGRHHS